MPSFPLTTLIIFVMEKLLRNPLIFSVNDVYTPLIEPPRWVALKFYDIILLEFIFYFLTQFLTKMPKTPINTLSDYYYRE